MYCKTNKANFKVPCLTCIERNAVGGGGGVGIYVSTINGVKQRFPSMLNLSKQQQLVARALFKQFEIKRCLLLLVQTFMIPHKAHICTAGIALRRSGTKGLNDLTENRKKITIVIFTVHKLQQCLNQCLSEETLRINF